MIHLVKYIAPDWSGRSTSMFFDFISDPSGFLDVSQVSTLWPSDDPEITQR